MSEPIAPFRGPWYDTDWARFWRIMKSHAPDWEYLIILAAAGTTAEQAERWERGIEDQPSANRQTQESLDRLNAIGQIIEDRSHQRYWTVKGKRYKNFTGKKKGPLGKDELMQPYEDATVSSARSDSPRPVLTLERFRERKAGTTP